LARNGAGGAGRSSNRVSGANRVATRFLFAFILLFLSLVWLLVVKNRKPATAEAIAGFRKISVLEFHSHDANKTGRALTNGHPAIARRVHRYLFGERSFHFDADIKQQMRRFVKFLVSHIFNRHPIIICSVPQDDYD
jgi:hypothetical protein